METTYSKELANRIKKFLDDDQWNYSFDEKDGFFRFDLTIKARGINQLRYVLIVNDDSFNVYAISPVGPDRDDAKMMATMAEFIARANYKLKAGGGFQLDYRDGEIRFKCFVDCEDNEPSTAVIRNSIHYPAAIFETYGYGITGIIFQNLTAQEAIKVSEYARIRNILKNKGIGEEEVDGLIAKLQKHGANTVVDTDETASSIGTDSETI
jgi:hypothetical protein